MESRAFTISGAKLNLITFGNASQACVLGLDKLLSTTFLIELQKRVEEVLNVKILSLFVTSYRLALLYSTPDYGIIYFVHEPKEKAKVAHLPEFELDARL